MLVGVGEERLTGITVRQGQRSCQGCRVEITSLNSHFASLENITRYRRRSKRANSELQYLCYQKTGVSIDDMAQTKYWEYADMMRAMR
jgi:hypothetical protein